MLCCYLIILIIHAHPAQRPPAPVVWVDPEIAHLVG